jgi:hypothetical protein
VRDEVTTSNATSSWDFDTSKETATLPLLQKPEEKVSLRVQRAFE